MDSNVLQKIKEALSTSTSIGIAVGPHPSLDDKRALSAIHKRWNGHKACKPLEKVIDFASSVPHSHHMTY